MYANQSTKDTNFNLLCELFGDVPDHDVDDLLLEELGDVVDHGEGERDDQLWSS